MQTDDREIYGNIIIRTLETKLAMAERRGQHEMLVTTDVMKDILSLLERQDKIIKQYQKADGFLFVHGWKWEDHI